MDRCSLERGGRFIASDSCAGLDLCCHCLGSGHCVMCSVFPLVITKPIYYKHYRYHIITKVKTFRANEEIHDGIFTRNFNHKEVYVNLMNH